MSRDVASSVKQLAARIRAEGYTVGYLGLQYPCDAGVAVFESVGPGEHYKRLGAGGVSGTPTSVQVAGFIVQQLLESVEPALRCRTFQLLVVLRQGKRRGM